MSSRLPTRTVSLPRHGYAFVTVIARDANGFTHYYSEIEVDARALAEALGRMQLHPPAEGQPVSAGDPGRG